jgi:hypothetical protein
MGEQVSTIEPHELELAHSAAIIENELHPGGFLRDIAAAKVDGGELSADDTPDDVAEIVLAKPEGGKRLAPRYTLDEASAANPAVKQATAANSERITGAAETLGLRNIIGGERQPEDLPQVDPDKAVFFVESGANKTSVTRRGVAKQAMHELYGDDLSRSIMYQSGGDREISPTVTKEVSGEDGRKQKVTQPNKEHATIRALAPSLPEDESFTEFEANLATALADGYNDIGPGMGYHPAIGNFYRLRHESTDDPDAVVKEPDLLLFDPFARDPESAPETAKAGSSLSSGFTSLDAMIKISDETFSGQAMGLADKHLVMVSNGQYREKDKLQVTAWASANGVDMQPPVAIGDEPGDVFPHPSGDIVVPERAPSAYVTELTIQKRLADKQLPDMPQA